MRWRLGDGIQLSADVWCEFEEQRSAAVRMSRKRGRQEDAEPVAPDASDEESVDEYQPLVSNTEADPEGDIVSDEDCVQGLQRICVAAIISYTLTITTRPCHWLWRCCAAVIILLEPCVRRDIRLSHVCNFLGNATSRVALTPKGLQKLL